MEVMFRCIKAKEFDKDNPLTLKTVAETVNLSYTTVLAHYREFKAINNISLFNNLQKNDN